MACYAVIVFNAQHEDSAVGVCKSGGGVCHLIADFPPIAGPLVPFRALQKGLAFIVLPFVLMNEGSDIKRRIHVLLPLSNLI